MTWSVTTAPASEPLDLAAAKLHLKIETAETAEDALVTALIKAAREHVEAICERALITQVWTERQACFPEVIELRGGKVTAVASVKYVDADGNLQTLDPAAYELDLTTEPATVREAYDTTWPETRPSPAAVRVEYTVGYGNAAAVPAALIAALKLILTNLYANRSGTIDAKLQKNPAVAALLLPYKRIRP